MRMTSAWDRVMPGDDLRGRALAPLFPDHVVELGHVEAARLGRPLLAADDPGGVGFPVHDVHQRVLDCPRVARLGSGYEPIPIRRLQACDELIQFFELANCALGYF
jgi:hypothetical protein